MSEIEKLRAELESARASLRLLESILRHAPAFIAHVTLEGRFLYLNREAHGLPDEDQSGRTIYEYSDPASHAMIREAIAQVVATGRGTELESIGAGADGKQHPYYTRVAPVKKDGVVESVVLISTDIGRLKETENALMESQAYLQHVLDATGTGVWWWDIDRNAGGRDERAAQLFDVDVADADMATMTEFVHPDDRQSVRETWSNVVATATEASTEHRLVRRNGTIRWVRASGKLVVGAFGRRLLGGVRDVTERKLLESRLAQTHKLESIGRLVGGIAHDFNNMLTVIASHTDLALRKLSESSPLHRDLTAVRLAADRSIALTSQLLAFARRQASTPDIVRLDEMLRRIEDSLRRTLGRKVELAFELRATRPVRIDVRQLEQVLTNLASNARDAMPDGGRFTIETADVHLEAKDVAAQPGVAAGDYVRIRATDTGIGIPAENLERVFEPFFTTKEQGKGTGLGLATSYGLIAQHGGFITASSTVGAGTTFEVSLPAAS